MTDLQFVYLILLLVTSKLLAIYLKIIDKLIDNSLEFKAKHLIILVNSRNKIYNNEKASKY